MVMVVIISATIVVIIIITLIAVMPFEVAFLFLMAAQFP
jgi:hypothetical protein